VKNTTWQRQFEFILIIAKVNETYEILLKTAKKSNK
jgi:hypothetical protein